jgi:hypothetical protein
MLAHSKVPTQHRRLEVASTSINLSSGSIVAGDAFRMNDMQPSLGSANSSTWRLRVNGAALYLIEIP